MENDTGAKAKDLIDVAIKEVGYREKINNGSKYASWFGLDNNPYSAMFVSWCFAMIGRSDLIAVTSEKGFASPKIGYDHFLKNDLLLKKNSAVKPGDILFIAQKANSRHFPLSVAVATKVRKGWVGRKRLVIASTVEADCWGEFGEPKGVHRKLRVVEGFGSSVIGVFRPNY